MAAEPQAAVARTTGPQRRRRPRLEDVAARAGVSRALVSIVMRDAPGASAATRARVLAVADELGYRPDGHARLLAGRQPRLLGVTLALNNPFHADVAEYVYTAAEPRGYEVVLSAISQSRAPRVAVDSLLSYRCAAAILVGALVPARALAALAGELPVVVVGQPAPRSDVDVVRGADAAGMTLAVEHLTGLGHRRITHVDGGRAPGAAARRNGFRTAMRRAGLAAEAALVAGGETEQDGAAAAHAILAGGLPDALIAYNDRCAAGLLETFARSGVQVPDEVSVVGYDDSHVARLPYLRLTTIRQDTAALAEIAVQRAVGRLEGENFPRREVVIAPRLVVRGTTAPAR